ncbi:MAG: bifunctional hydroxymethylpyrimidine kinase/phosphomethylpyrimidine kinase [Verrucomicrobiota bacterium]
MAEQPVALTIAGSDSSAGAGLQADLKVFTARGVYGVTAVTSVVAEVPGRVSRIMALEPGLVSEQIRLLLRAFPVGAAKTGLLCNAAIVSAVAREWREAGNARPLVVDPVMVATSGDSLLEPAAIDVYERELFPQATLLTPNLDEAERLLGEPIRQPAAMRRAVAALAQKYGVAVLLKGGHLRQTRALDLLWERGKITEVSARFLPGIATHGTGCTFSAAIAAELAKGTDLCTAVTRGKRVVTAAIRRHFVWQNGQSKIVALNHQPASAAR